MVVGAPYGLFVNYLPGYYSSFWFGSTRYFYADDTYYTYEPARRGYVVTRSPYGDDQEDEATSELDEDLYVYPAKGQSEQQQADDRYECHRWAADQTQLRPGGFGLQRRPARGLPARHDGVPHRSRLQRQVINQGFRS